MRTRNARTSVEETSPECDGEPCAHPAKQWDPFPQPADCSVKWDFEALSQPPRVRDQAEAASTAPGNA